MKTAATVLLSGLILSIASIAYADNGQRRGPPAESIAACSDQAADTACSFTSPRGDEISGMCGETRNGDMVCKPEGMGKGRGEGRGKRQPPAAALEACAEQSADTACSFTSPRGDEISGMCGETRNGDMACKPEGMGRGRGEGRGGKRPPAQDEG